MSQLLIRIFSVFIKSKQLICEFVLFQLRQYTKALQILERLFKIVEPLGIWNLYLNYFTGEYIDCNYNYCILNQ